MLIRSIFGRKIEIYHPLNTSCMYKPKLLCLLSFFCCMSRYLPIYAQTNAQLSEIAADFQSSYKVPGLAIALVRPDSIFLGLAGTRDGNRPDKIKATDKFHLGSNSKAITAFIAAKLVEEGQMNWTDELRTVLPELAPFIHQSYQKINLMDLLSHRTGLPAFEDESSPEFRALKKRWNTDPISRMEFAKVALGIPAAPLGEKGHFYSNAGYIIAALMLERKTGESYNALLASQFATLGYDCYIGFPQEEFPTQNKGHRKRTLAFLSRQKYRSLPASNPYEVQDYFAPAGDLSMNINDLSHFIQLHLKGLLGDNNFLSSATYQRLHFGLDDYALGWYNGYIGKTDQRFSYHGGSTGTFSSAIMLSPDRETGIIILINAESKAVQKLKTELRELLWARFAE